MLIVSRSLASNSTTVAHTLTAEESNSVLDILEALFAGLSVLIGILALVIGMFQLMKHRKRSASVSDLSVFELEAGLPQASTIPQKCTIHLTFAQTWPGESLETIDTKPLLMSPTKSSS